MDANLEYYKIFYYIGSYGSITQAADRLSLSQPAVSQGLKQLERAMGTPLFIRTPKGVRFTSEGEALYEYVKRGYETLLQGERIVKQMLNQETGEIHIGASDMTLKYYLLPYLESFHNAYPGIKITVTNGPTPETLQYLGEGKIDFGVVSSPVKEKDGVRVRPVRYIEDIFVAGKKFFSLEGKILNYKELEQLPMLCLEGNTSTRTYIDGYLKEQGVVFQPEFELATSDMLVQFALKNMGVACVVRDFAEEHLKKGDIFELSFDRPIPKRNFLIVTNERSMCSRAAEALLGTMDGSDINITYDEYNKH